MATTKIEWSDAVWNPVSGCTRAGIGCDACYAVRMTYRLENMGQKKYAGLTVLNQKGDRHFNGVVRTDDAALSIPLRWKKPRLVFVNSMSDLFHRDVPFDFVDKVFAVMALCPRHTFQVLTKRPERMAEYTSRTGRSIEFLERGARELGYTLKFEGIGLTPWPLPNVWLGCSPVNQKTYDEYSVHMRNVTAAVKWYSLEPLLGPIDLRLMGEECDVCGNRADEDGIIEHGRGCFTQDSDGGGWSSGRPRQDAGWVVVGGESGPQARGCDVQDIRSIVEQCRAAGVPCFVKQLGSRPYINTKARTGERFTRAEVEVFSAHVAERLADALDGFKALSIKDSKGGDVSEFPEDLRVREFPTPAEAAR